MLLWAEEREKLAEQLGTHHRCHSVDVAIRIDLDEVGADDVDVRSGEFSDGLEQLPGRPAAWLVVLHPGANAGSRTSISIET